MREDTTQQHKKENVEISKVSNMSFFTSTELNLHTKNLHTV